jgi:hypothetical protein
VWRVQLSNYQTAGFEARSPTASLHADMVRRAESAKIIRFGGRAVTHDVAVVKTDIRKFPVCQTSGSRTLARFRASLMSPGAKLFMTTSSSTFVFMLGFLS